MVAVERSSLARSLGKVAVDLCDLNFGSAIKGVIDATGAFKPETATPPDAPTGATLLLQRAAYAAAVRTIQAEWRNAPVLAVDGDPREVEAAILRTTADLAIDLTAEAFAEPERWPAVEALLALFDAFMDACAVAEERRRPIRRAFEGALPLTLAGEWRNEDRAEEYRALKAALEPTPFDPAAQRSLHWNAYRARLIEAVNTPLRTLAPEMIRCSLNDLYVPLRAAVGDPEAPERAGGERRKRPLVWLDDTLYGWATQPAHAPADRIRVLSGEPGAGKSSACAKLAAHLAADKRRVLLVPLARLNIRGDSLGELSRYLSHDLGHDPFTHLPASGEPLVLILDGLDELAKAGQGATLLLNGFIIDLGMRLQEWNRDGTRVLLLLVGRPAAVGAVVTIGVTGRNDGNRLHVLNYWIDESARRDYEPVEMAALDQRLEWWEKFDPVCGMPIPLQSNDPHIGALIKQPLLNWLLAQILTLEGPECATRLHGAHVLYIRLFNNVLDGIHRRESGGGGTEAIDSVRARLEHMLEEVAVAAWQVGTDRAVPLANVEQRLRDCGLSNELKRLSDDSDAALTTLLDCFFCRVLQVAEYRHVEFTHKSFSQFLIARRVVRLMVGMPQGRVLPPKEAEDMLKQWLELCGEAILDGAIFDFLIAEVASRLDECTKELQKALAALLAESLESGMPLPEAATRSRTAERQIRNAEIALLCAVSALSRVPGRDPSPIRIDLAILPATLHRLFGPMKEWSVARQTLHIFRLAGADLSGANLTEVYLDGVDLTGADLTRADLSAAKLAGANLTNAKLWGANLWAANLTRANLSRADLSFATLTAANFTDANLSDADLTHANLWHTFMTEIQLKSARIYRGF